MARYKIVITEYAEDERLVRREWAQGADPENEDRGYGWTPQVRQVEYVEREILKQSVEDVNVVAVIKAINGIT